MNAPARDRRPARAPARLGLTDPDAGHRLADLGWWDGDDPVPGAALVVWALARAADPDLALVAVERLRESLGAQGWGELDGALRNDQGLRGRLFGVLGGSTALGDHLVSQPERWRALRTTSTPGRVFDDSWLPSADDRRRFHLRAVGADPDAEAPVATLTGHEAVDALRLRWRDDVLLLAAADLQAVCEPELPIVPVEVVSAQLADVAAAGLEAALAVARAQVGPERAGDHRLAVIGMGKCGGRELNYVSDIDVIFVAEGAVDSAGRVAATMMRVATEAFLEVDANLRPEGRSGQLVRTLEAHVAYYQRWARTWEFQALLKARPVAGDLALGQEYCEALAPMVWSAAERDDFVADVRAMRRRVEDHIRHDHADRELKLGRGGLRDVEFAVQLLQLVHGRGDDTLRSPNTLETLAALGEGGYVGRDDAANLAASYRFLRMLEHRVQLQKLRRTHLFPSDEDTAGLRWLARAAKLRPDGRRDAVGVLQAELSRNTVRVRRLHEKLFYRPLLESVARVPSEQLVLTESSATKRLAALGWSSPAGALKHVAALTAGTSRAARIQRALMPVLLDRLGNTADPDHGLLAYRKVSEALASTPWFLALLRDEGLAADRLMYVLGTSRWVAEMMPRSPEVLRLLGGDGPTADLTARDPAEVARSLRAAVARHTDPRSAGNVARSLRRVELLRVACADLLGLTDVPSVCAALSSVWVAVLQAALEVAGARGGRGRAPARADRDHRDGPVGRRGAGLRLRRRRRRGVRARRGRLRPGRDDVRPPRGRGGHGRAGRAEPGPAARGRHQAASRGAQRPAGAHAVLVRGLPAAVGRDLGVPGAAAGAAGGRRRGAGGAVLRDDRPLPVPRRRPAGVGGHGDPADEGPRRRRAPPAGRRPRAAHEARDRRARRRRVDRAAPAAPARRAAAGAADDLDAGGPGRAARRRAPAP